MKTLFLIMLLMTQVVIYAQKETSFTDKYAEFAQPTLDKDTLYLTKGSFMSQGLFEVWFYDPLWNGKHSPDRKSTRLNSSHRCISYAVFCLKKKKTKKTKKKNKKTKKKKETRLNAGTTVRASMT